MNKPNTQYRIYTADTDRETIEKLVAQYFDRVTIYKVSGFWKSCKEPALVIEILAEDWHIGMVLDIAEVIKEGNSQESVLVAVQKIESIFV